MKWLIHLLFYLLFVLHVIVLFFAWLFDEADKELTDIGESLERKL